eukprot:TRINITY_DN32_c1_g3_i1.p1 TRINITY_DN32_c1_g3~~TRINITY_DN32_c1_g3_i1.p1  ORF type:complete len:1186 (+),score=292.57 TRINITY_DN32_c1_g3_i1:96-3653(+)
MDINVVRESRYRNIFGKHWRKEVSITNVKPSSGENSIKSNGTYLAFPWASSGAGNLAVVPINFKGKLPDKNPIIDAHPSAIIDFDLHPFREDVVATGSREGDIRLWQVPAEFKANVKDPLLSLKGHSKRLVNICFHPYASDVLLSTSFDLSVRLWDVESGKEAVNIAGHENPPQSVSWCEDGSTFATSSNKDKTLRIFDIRAKTPLIKSTVGHEGAKGFQVSYLDRGRIATVGFHQSQRQISLWDTKDITKPYTTVAIDIDSSILYPYYEPGIGVMFLSGKGNSIYYYEVNSEAPFVHLLNKFQTPTTHSAVGLLPKRVCDFQACEIARFIRLTQTTVETVGFHVPRKNEQYFQEDLYLDVPNNQPSLTAAQFLSGKNGKKITVNLKPKDMVSVFEIPAELGGKNREVIEEKREISSATAETAAIIVAGAASGPGPSETSGQKKGKLMWENRGWFFATFEPRYCTIEDEWARFFLDESSPVSQLSLRHSDVKEVACVLSVPTRFVVIENSGKTHTFDAASPQDRDSWVLAYTNAVTKFLAPKPTVPPTTTTTTATTTTTSSTTKTRSRSVSEKEETVEEEEEEEEDEGGKKITPSGIKSKGAKGPIKLKDEEVEEEEGDQNKSSASLVSKGPAFKSSNKDLGPEEVLSGGWGMAPAAPPPPPGGAGGPPPPPPPPGGKGPPPPPPPGGKMKAKVVIKPKMKLRKLDWKKIPKTQLNTTIWKMLAVEGVELDEPSMIEYFKIPDDDSEQPKKKADNKGPIIALDMKKSNHVGLMLSMIKMTHNEIRQAILNVEDTKFTEDTLRAFIKLAPTKEDIESLKPFLTAPPETLARLGNSEKLFLAIMDIERLKEKLVSFLFKRTFTSASARLKDDIELAHLAVTELTKNVKFAKLLELILNIGNWLNYGTYAGDCFGFTLESLDKMRGTKSPTHPEISLLHYLVWFVAEKRPRLLDFTEELQYIDKGSQDHITAIQSEFSEMTQGFSAMTGELQTLAANPPAGGPDPFTLKMNEFAIKAKGEMENLTHLLDELNKANALLFSTYAADKGTCLITVVQAFCQQFVACRLENEQRQEQQEKPKKKRKKIKKKNTSTSSKTKGLMNTPKLGENGEEIRADDDDNDDNADDENALMKKLFPGKEGEEDDTAPKGDDDDEVPKAKKVKKIKKKVKKKKVKKADDDDDAGKDDDAE